MYYLNEHVSCKYYSYTVENGFANHTISDKSIVSKSNTLSDNLVFVCQGSFLLSLESEPPVQFSSGDFFYVPAGVHLQCEALVNTECLVLSCATYDLYERLMEIKPSRGVNTGECKGYGLCVYKQVDHLNVFVKQMWEYLADGMKCKHLQEAKMNEVLVMLNLYYSESELHQLFHPVISSCDHIQFRSEVLRHVHKVKSATELAEKCGFGVRQFERKFKNIFDSSPYQWMLEQKKRKLLDKLIDRELPIKHVVIDFDFCSVSHLNEFCKRFFGKTAAEIRKRDIV